MWGGWGKGGIFCIVFFLMGGGGNRLQHGSKWQLQICRTVKEDIPRRKLLAFCCAKVLNVID